MRRRTVNRGLVRHLEGWQALLVAIAIAALGIALGTPRAVFPTELPLPVPSPAALRATMAEERARAAALERTSEAERTATYDLRRIGELLRRYGAADVERDEGELARSRVELLATVRTFRAAHGDEPLLRLRAYQMFAFLRGLDAWEVSGKVDREAREVGGDFATVAERSGWVDAHHRLLADDVVLAALFKRRFAEILALHDPAYLLTVDEARALYAFWLAHPPTAMGDRDTRHRATWDWLAKKVAEIGAIDPSYPLLLAQAVVHLQLGDARQSVEDLRGFLQRHPDGPYVLRARNYLVAALELAQP